MAPTGERSVEIGGRELLLLSENAPPDPGGIIAGLQRRATKECAADFPNADIAVGVPHHTPCNHASDIALTAPEIEIASKIFRAHFGSAISRALGLRLALGLDRGFEALRLASRESGRLRSTLNHLRRLAGSPREHFLKHRNGLI